MKKPIPKFKIEAEEFKFWSSTGAGADSTKYLDWSKAQRTKLPKLKLSRQTNSVCLREEIGGGAKAEQRSSSPKSEKQAP